MSWKIVVAMNWKDGFFIYIANDNNKHITNRNDYEGCV
jgi:hypothetical protein